MKQLKPKKCRSCRELFEPRTSLQVACSVKCALDLARAKGEKLAKQAIKAQRKQIIDDKAKLKDKDRSYWLQKAQKSFNAWIRARDADKRCISCDRHHKGQYHAGHYRPAGVNSALRFDPRNVHKQCSVCNNHKSGNLTEYRAAIVRLYGEEVAKWLDNNHDVKRWTIEELKSIDAEYRKRLKLGIFH